MTRDLETSKSLSNEARQAVAEAFDALEEWRVEIGAANERCLAKVLDHVKSAHRALGWTEQATSAAKDHLLKASSIQSEMIEQTMELWEQQLEAQNRRPGLPRSRLQAPTPTQFALPTSEMKHFGEMTLAPFLLWMEVAQAWQRAWISTMSGGALSAPSSKSSPSRTEGWTRAGGPSS